MLLRFWLVCPSLAFELVEAVLEVVAALRFPFFDDVPTAPSLEDDGIDQELVVWSAATQSGELLGLNEILEHHGASGIVAASNGKFGGFRHAS